MYEIFKDCGEIDEVLFSSMRYSRGKIYSIVRFYNVQEERVLATKLGNISSGEGRSMQIYQGFKERRPGWVKTLDP